MQHVDCHPEIGRALEEIVGSRSRAILGIAGAPGAGKTTLAEALVAEVAARHGRDWVAHLPMDGFHLADEQLVRLGLRDRKGAPGTFDGDGYAFSLARVADHPDRPIYVPGFDRTFEQPVAAALVIPAAARLVVTEGNYLLLDEEPWRSARAHLQEVWWVDVDDVLRVDRLVARHVEFGKSSEAAVEWVARSDEANAALVADGADRADRRVTWGPTGWEFSRSARPGRR